MESLYLLIPLSVAIVMLALWIFFRASDSGQFDDLVGPGLRILQDDDRPGATGETDSSARGEKPQPRPDVKSSRSGQF
jgi:cbb3-type cytochrome oxidase maturation protein